MSTNDEGPSILDFLPSSMRQKLTMERLAMARAISELSAENQRLIAAAKAADLAHASLLLEWERGEDWRDHRDVFGALCEAHDRLRVAASLRQEAGKEGAS